jgi:hypothetical protein
MTPPRTPQLADVILAAIDTRMVGVHTSIPGRIETFDPATQTAGVKPMIKRRSENADGTYLDESIPVVPRVPVCFPRAGSLYITWPVAPGDLCELVFSEQSRDNFKAAVEAAEVDPDDFRRFDLSDAFAIPGGYPEALAIKDFDPTDIVIGIEGGVQIHLKPDGKIALGSKTPTDNEALASLVKAEIQGVVDTIGGLTPVPNDGGATIITAMSTYVVGDVKSNIVESD